MCCHLGTKTNLSGYLALQNLDDDNTTASGDYTMYDTLITDNLHMF